MKPIIIFGGQTLGQTVLNILQKNKLFVYGFLDEKPHAKNTILDEIPILGMPTDEKYLSLLQKDCVACLALPHPQQRQAIIHLLEKRQNIQLINAIHPRTSLGRNLHLGQGNVIHTGASLEPDVIIGKGCIVGAHTFLAYGVVLHDFVNIGPGTIVETGVTIGTGAYIGPSVTILPKLTIHPGTHIPAGTIITKDT